MVITFQIQIDPLKDKEFSISEIEQMKGEMYEFCSDLEKYKEYIRAEFYVDGKIWVTRN